MSPVIFACVICGYAVDGYVTSVERSWLKEFRAIYSNQEGISISGVGCYDDPHDGTWFAPPLPHMRWDDQEYIWQPDHKIPVMKQRPAHGIHGYIFHDACWRLLENAMKPKNIPLDRLFDICRSLPFPLRGIGVSWGHDYGGLNIIDNVGYYPWEDRLVEQYGQSEPYQYAKYNPYDVPELPGLLTMPLRETQNYKSDIGGNNFFALLPWEICEAIAIILPTTDVMSLLKSSKAFLPLLTSQTFWASRFLFGNERDFVFETRDKRPADWITLYQMTNYTQSPPGLKNRKRIWTLVQGIVNLLQLHPIQYPGRDAVLPNYSSPRSAIAADIKEVEQSNYFFNEGCRLFQKQSAFIPKDLVTIAFSFAGDGNIEYLAGIRFISQNGHSIRLGYYCGKEIFHGATMLKGFILAVGSRGIQGLRVISGDEGISRWFGSSEKCPVTQRLLFPASVTALEAGLDGYKMICLAVFASESSLIRQQEISALRDTALWYPSVPPRELYLNENSFTGENPLVCGYQPLCWIQFGGANGGFLQSLTEICVARLGDLCSIEVHYKVDSTHTEVQRLGRRRMTNFADVIRFPIDGPGGELIQSVEVSVVRFTGDNVYSFYRHGKLNSFKISTNRGRSVHFEPQGSLAEKPNLTPMSIAPGTTITGFYASQHPEEGLVSLGVLSELIH